MPLYKAITPSLIVPPPPFGCGVISMFPEAGTVIANHTSLELDEKPPIAAPPPPAQVDGVGAPIEADAPTVVNWAY